MERSGLKSINPVIIFSVLITCFVSFLLGFSNVFAVEGIIIQLTTDQYDHTNPQISGDKIVWQGIGDWGNNEIFFYDGSIITQLTDDIYNDSQPQISGNNIVWQGYDGDDWEIFRYEIKEFPWILFLPSIVK